MRKALLRIESKPPEHTVALIADALLGTQGRRLSTEETQKRAVAAIAGLCELLIRNGAASRGDVNNVFEVIKEGGDDADD